MRALKRLAAFLTGYKKKITAIVFSLPLLLFLIILLQALPQVKLIKPAASPFFEDYRGQYLAEAAAVDRSRGFWEIAGPLPERITNCLLAVEDRRFHEHNGIDWRSLARAFFNNLRGKKLQGASTIAMQVARLQNPAPRSYWRKLREMLTARLMIARFGRDRLLRQYLLLLPQGNQIFGTAYAARRYFQKPLQDLSWAESALLAALARSPGQMNLFKARGFSLAKTRAALILDLVSAQGLCRPDEYQDAKRNLARLPQPKAEQRPAQALHAILQLENLIEREIQGGFTRPIRTSLDLDLQTYLNNLARRTLTGWRHLGLGNMAVLVAEKNNGQLRAYLGSENYFDDLSAGAIDYAQVKRSSGSTIKPFIFAHALAEGTFTPASVISDLPYSVSHASGDYVVTNFDEKYLGPVLFRKALANSRNIPAVRIFRNSEPLKAYDLLLKLGLADPHHDIGHYGLNLAVGGLYVSLYDLVSAYGVLANEGRSFQLSLLPASEPNSRLNEQVLPAEVARHITLMLADATARLPSFPRLGPLEYPFAVAVKTGTSQGFRDAWAIGYSHRYLVGVWLGHPDNHPMKNVSGQNAARLLQQIMMQLHPVESRGVNDEPFAPPSGYAAVRICQLSGELAGENCPEALLEYFRPGSEPVDPCQVHRRHADSKTYLHLDSEYAVWATRQGLSRPPAVKGDPRQARIAIQNPVGGSRFRLDPDTPPQFQTISLRAKVSPQVPQVIWSVNGRELEPTSYPYELRWPLHKGSHTFRVRFARAEIWSAPVTVQVLD